MQFCFLRFLNVQTPDVFENNRIPFFPFLYPARYTIEMMKIEVKREFKAVVSSLTDPFIHQITWPLFKKNLHHPPPPKKIAENHISKTPFSTIMEAIKHAFLCFFSCGKACFSESVSVQLSRDVDYFFCVCFTVPDWAQRRNKISPWQALSWG